MKVIIRLFCLILISVTFASCSVLLGGIVALDNSANKGKKEIVYEKLIELRKGKLITLELSDSTRVSGKYKGYKKNVVGNKAVTIISILDNNNESKFIDASKVHKYIYTDEGGSVSTAVSIGGVIDALIIYGLINGPGFGGGVRVF
ncbi:MAG: hypothetical protein WCS69_15550 [Ignavibacteriaceae bacterium]|jgi:hypothetical protein